MKDQPFSSPDWPGFKGYLVDVRSAFIEFRAISQETVSILLRSATERRWDMWGDCTRLLGILCLLWCLWFFIAILPLIAFGGGMALAQSVMWLFHDKATWWEYSFAGAGCVVGMFYAEAVVAFLRRLANRRSNEIDGPPLAAQYLLLIVPRKYRDNLVGDLEEEYLLLLPTYGRRWTDRWYWWQVGAAFGRFLLHLVAGLATVWKLIR